LPQIAKSIERFGFTNPILVSRDLEIIAGHGRVEAAKLLGLSIVPVIELAHLTANERRAYMLADNKLALNATWNQELLAVELSDLIEIDFDVELSGFSMAEIDIVIGTAEASSPQNDRGPDDVVPELSDVAVSRRGELWQLGRHRLLCGDALDEADLRLLMSAEQARLLFTDPPYNVPINGHVCGSGAVRHREFVQASGELSRGQFTEFLRTALVSTKQHLMDGAIAYVCMDWRHVGELNDAGRDAFSALKNIIVWNKTNGGMGSFYRSKHELIFVFKHGSAPHINNFGLGDTGRYRTNVWDYPGISSLGPDRAAELAMHPTVKPVALVADALRDCSDRGDIILDPFGGSGTTLIAAEKTGRCARLIELDPLYCDTIIRRWQRLTGQAAILALDGSSFEAVQENRRDSAALQHMPCCDLAKGQECDGVKEVHDER
jgi:DNA modification methylase